MSQERIYTASSAIVLPRMSANEVSTLAGQLLARCAQRISARIPLPQLILDARQRLEAARKVLTDALSPRPPGRY